MKRTTTLLAALALTAVLLAPAAASAQGFYRYYNGPLGYGRSYYNPWSGGYVVNQGGYNPWTGAYGWNRSYYNPYWGNAYASTSYVNPWAGRVGGYRSVYNPYTGQYAYQWYGY